jgi:iron(II)-dependent oxidoreductase
MTRDLEGAQLLGPMLEIVNPPLWEIGHLAWFQEYWCLRQHEGNLVADSILPGADALYDSAKVAHNTRWSLPLPNLAQTRSYETRVLERVLKRIDREPDNMSLQYFAQLAAFHEDMHSEAFHYTRQTLGYRSPFGEPADSINERPPQCFDIEFAGGSFQLGAARDDGFVFDNEKWAHEVRIAPFHMARNPVTHANYLEFVESEGYRRSEFWDREGWAWRTASRAAMPRYWSQNEGSWFMRRFDQKVPLPLGFPVMHVNWHEVQAYCRYAQRRLPTEGEWEYAAAYDASTTAKRRYPWGTALPTAEHANLERSYAASVDAYPQGDSPSGCRQLIGNVWEWTASAFDPYPGFVADPYKEYSQPWFGTHKVLRGGSFATTRGLIRNTWRNFYTPDRGDVFAGFRTCALNE